MRNLKEKKINILISIFLLLLFSNFTQDKKSEEFSFDKLQCKKITFEDISLDDGVYDDRISPVIGSLKIKKSKIYPFKLSNKYPLYHGCYDSIPENRHDNKDEYLQFYDTKININSLLKNNLTNRKIYSDDVYILFTRSIDFFKFKGKDFILLSADNRGFYRNLEGNYWILLQIKNHDIINSFCFMDGYLGGKDCFGDFNNDGLLDYMNWNFEKDKISLYSLRDDKFEIDKNHYIKVKQSKEELELKEGRGYSLIYDLFDRKNSKWFYKL